MHLIALFLNRSEEPELAVRRLREFGVPDPLFLRARSTAQALAAEVPVFSGLRSLAHGADEDRLVLLTLKTFAAPEEADRLVARLQLEMDADQPPSGRIIAIPVVAAARQEREASRA